MRIALADDEQELLDQVSSVILSAGHEVDGYRNGQDLQNGLRRETYDVVLLDWNMPGRSGIDVLNWATENLSPLPPFILLTSRHDKEDIVRGLEAGAIDYIVKPESDEVIRARVEAAGRRTKSEALPSTANVGPYVFDRREKSATLSGEPVHLTAKEFDLLDLLLQNLGRPLSRGYLFSKVWGSEADLETRTIDVHVSRLRGKLDLKPENGFVIRTVFGFGYRMDEYIEDADNNE
ncbi:response regulator transcription factor [Erythrobacter sp. W53]|uniref:response regulator transcription factor n=1 Tax=Erythrobacteraceae TaxID=335929 RepID=UPI0036D405C9